jgi:hypothetical protein
MFSEPHKASAGMFAAPERLLRAGMVASLLKATPLMLDLAQLTRLMKVVIEVPASAHPPTR